MDDVRMPRAWTGGAQGVGWWSGMRGMAHRRSPVLSFGEEALPGCVRPSCTTTHHRLTSTRSHGLAA